MKIEEEGRLLFMGVDPGTTNLGLSWYDPKYNRGVMHVHDIHCWNGHRHALEAPYDYNAIMIRLVDEYEELLSNTTHLAYERMDHPASNLDVCFAWSILEQTIRVRYPNIKVAATRPQAVRKFLDTQGSYYKERKQNSWDTPLLSDEDFVHAQEVFKKRDGQPPHVDGVEALGFAVFAYHYRHTLFAPKPYERTYPCTDRKLVMRFNVAETVMIDIPEPAVAPRKKRVKPSGSKKKKGPPRKRARYATKKKTKVSKKKKTR